MGLKPVVQRECAEGGFLSSCDAFCISDNYTLAKETPCVTYGLRGIAYFFLEVQCSTKDLHSGVIGGSVHEAMRDLVKVMATLTDTSGKITIDGIYDDVKPMTPEEEATYDPLDFDVEEYKVDVGAPGDLLFPDKKGILTHRWRYPSLSLHGVEGAFSASGEKTVIPAKVIGKFSIRLVPDMNPEEVEKAVQAHVDREFAKLGSPNSVRCFMSHGAPAWMSDFNDPNFIAGRRAMKQVWGRDPDLTREGGSIPITLEFANASGKNVMLLPVGSCDDGAHSQNEKLDLVRYIAGIKVLGCYLFQFAEVMP